MLCTAVRRISDHYVVIVEGDWEEKCCVLQVEDLVIFVW
jgi:hypothetical protein